MKLSPARHLALSALLTLACKPEAPPSVIHDFQPPAPTPPAPAAPPVSIHQMIQALPPVGTLDMNKVVLGRRLFHDTRLSADNTLSCASCHAIDHGGVDGTAVSTGIRGQHGSINAPTVFNSRFNFVQFWDGRAADLAAQAAGPVANPAEMGNTWPNVVSTLQREPTYVSAFARSYPDGITPANVQNAIATYENILVTPSRVDRFLAGDRSALNAEETAGAELFASVGCTTCHMGVNVGGSIFQKMGLRRDYFTDRGNITDADFGRFNVTHQDTDRFFFKVPSLRNVALTAPYFHDGSRRTLPDAVRAMGRHQLGVDLEDAQIARLVAFLTALTGEIPPEARMPSDVPAVPLRPAGAPPAVRPGAPAAPRPAAPAARPAPGA